MSFVHQEKENDYRSGAFALAYWKWISVDAKSPDDTTGKDEAFMNLGFVDSIYQKVRFDIAKYPTWNALCDPLRMKDWIAKRISNRKIVFYKGKMDFIRKKSDSKLVEKMSRYMERSKEHMLNENIPDITYGEYAILVLADDSIVHYVLAVGVAGGMYIINPLDGCRRVYPHSNNGLVVLDEMNNTKAGIYISRCLK